MSNARCWHRPSLAAWCAVIIAATLMGALGIWQLARLEQKEALIAAIARGAEIPPSKILPYSSEALHAAGFQRFQVTGEFLYPHEAHLAASYLRGRLGYRLLTPLRLEDGRILLVNRGWVPAAKKLSADRPETIIQGVQHYTVMLRTDRDHSVFTPNHDISHNIWFWRDIPTLRKITKLNILPVSADVIMESPDPEVLPVPSDGHIELRNDHLGYAITWFLIGLSAIVIFFFYHYRPDDEPA